MTVLAQFNALKKESDASTQLYQRFSEDQRGSHRSGTKSSNVRVVDPGARADAPTAAS